MSCGTVSVFRSFQHRLIVCSNFGETFQRRRKAQCALSGGLYEHVKQEDTAVSSLTARMQFLVELFALGAAFPLNWSRHFPDTLPAPGWEQRSKNRRNGADSMTPSRPDRTSTLEHGRV